VTVPPEQRLDAILNRLAGVEKRLADLEEKRSGDGRLRTPPKRETPAAL
jgi:hypothetical protein